MATVINNTQKLDNTGQHSDSVTSDKLESPRIHEPKIQATQLLTSDSNDSKIVNNNNNNNNKRNVRYKTFRKTVFRPRMSRLDSDTMVLELPEFRGFYTLFWVSLLFYVTQSMLSSYRTTGYPLKTVLFDLISRDLMVFAASDLVMVCSTLLVVPFHRAIVNRWCPLLMGTLIKYAIELTLVGGAVWWIFVRDWPWSQSISFLMHSCVMAMKVHSYMSVNGEFEAISRRLVVLDKKRSGDRLSSTEDLASTLDNIPYGNINNGHPVIKKRSSSSAYNGAAIKGRRKSEVRFDASVYDSLADEIKDLQSELSKGSTNYPQNVSFMNYVNFLLVPTLVYELEYPRTNRIRPLYVAEKLVATLGVSWCIYFLIEHFVYPTLRDLPNESLLESCVKLMIPFMLGWIMLFFVIFEGVCNAFAELTRFADRNFYDDWWNSCSFDEFARKWNKPVHEFLLRHVYLEAIDSYKVSKTNATFITFLFSSVFHELIAAVVARKFSLFFFAAQMSQLPLIWAMRAVKHKPMLGNAMFWILLYAGMPIIAIAYSRDHFLAVNKS